MHHLKDKSELVERIFEIRNDLNAFKKKPIQSTDLV
jgi:hypothetical protein